MPIDRGFDQLRACENVFCDGLRVDIRAMREWWRQATPEQRVQPAWHLPCVSSPSRTAA